MKILSTGHRYLLDNFEAKNKLGQALQFIEKEKDASGNFVTVRDGTTNDEVILAVLNRLEYLDRKLPAPENSHAISFLRLALYWLRKRTENRLARGVEGTPKP